MCRKLICIVVLGLALFPISPQERITASCSANTSETAMAFSPDSRYFGAVWNLNIIRIWDVQTQKVIQTIQLAPGEMLPSGLTFSPDDKLVVYTYHETV